MKLNRTQFITINALLCAIVLLFVFVPVAIGPVRLAFLPLIAIIISAQFVGIKSGLFTGFFFGLVSFISSFLLPGILVFAFHNPLISVFPRIFIGISAYYAMVGIKRLLPKLPEVFAYAIGTAAGVITNTVGVLGMILLFHYGKPLGVGTVINFEFISFIIISNSLLEILICTVVTPPIVFALKKAFRTK